MSAFERTTQPITPVEPEVTIEPTSELPVDSTVADLATLAVGETAASQTEIVADAVGIQALTGLEEPDFDDAGRLTGRFNGEEVMFTDGTGWDSSGPSLIVEAA